MPQSVRRAWLVLGSLTIQLDNPAAGWSCQSLDLGSPIVRSVMTNKPDADGIVDRTQYMGARTVVAAVSAISTAGARIDDVASAFAPFMVPSARPVLHYVLDRSGAAERTLTLRPDSYDWPIVGAIERDVALQWIAADPVARDPSVQTATAWAGSGTGGGRTYNLTFNRVSPRWRCVTGQRADPESWRRAGQAAAAYLRAGHCAYRRPLRCWRASRSARRRVLTHRIASTSTAQRTPPTTTATRPRTCSG